MSAKIKIAVCLLSFNHEKTISSVVDSILKQDGAKYKFYVSDDSSTDGSWGILQAFKNQGHEITLLKTHIIMAWQVMLIMHFNS